MENIESAKSNIISPDQLEIDATVPQCLDNQYVSDSTLNYILTNSCDYTNKYIKEQRKAEVHNEFIRSLIYSSQVIINRAYLHNNEFLYLNYTKDNPIGLCAFAELMRSGAIIPYLYRENSLKDKLEFEVQKAGDRAIKNLLEETGYDLLCVRLAVDNEVNNNKIAMLEDRFGGYLSGLNNKSEYLINLMASELLGFELVKSDWKLFVNNIKSLSEWAHNNGPSIKRDDVYKEWFIEKNKEVSDGRFKRPSYDFPFLYYLKKIVDLRYNTNLPDMMGRYTFTPIGLPSRVALQDFHEGDNDFKGVEHFVDQQLTKIKRTFMADNQKGMSLPILRELSISDVLEIRRDIPEWKQFKESQQAILSEPLRVLDNIESFQTHFDSFQRALSLWYNTKYQRNATETKYASFVTVALKVVGQTIVAGLDFGDNITANILAHSGALLIPEIVRGYSVKLLINVIDIQEMKLDRDRSYSLELMRSNQELRNEDVFQLIANVKAVQSDKISGQGQLGDMGKV